MINLLYDKNANPALRGRFTGKSIFSMMTGPSLNSLDYKQLDSRFTFSIKRLPLSHLKPTIWLCMEKQQDHSYKIWEDKTLIKIVTQEVYDKGYLQPQGPVIDGQESKTLFRMGHINKLKNVYWFKLAQAYKSATYFTEDKVQWGMDSERKDEHGIQGRRSIMLAHFRILHHLGFRRIYLLGVDFEMDRLQPYSYDRIKAPGAVAQNNLLYESLQIRLATLYPLMLQNGLEVFNCNPDSKLKVFPYMSYEDALNDKDSYMYRN